MSYANVTPTQALSRLLAAAKQINADECKDERVFHALQGEIGVAEGVLRDYVEPEPVAYANAAFFTTRQSEFAQNGTVIFPAKCGEVTMPLYDQPVAAQSAVAAASVPPAILARTEEIRQVMANPMGIGRNALLAYIEFLLAHIAFTNSAAPLHEAGNAAAPWDDFEVEKTGDEHHDASTFLMTAAQEWWDASKRANVHGAVKWLEGEDGAMLIYTRGEYRDALLENIHKLGQEPHNFSPAASPSIAAPTEVERDAVRWRTFEKALRTGHFQGPAHGRRFKIIETCPMYGEEKEFNDFIGAIDAAIATGEKVK